MLDKLPSRANKTECGIVNLDKSTGAGTHWVAYSKKGNQIEYFDSYGNLRPPHQIINYLGKNIKYNYDRYQEYNSVICGQLCLIFLYNNMYK